MHCDQIGEDPAGLLGRRIDASRFVGELGESVHEFRLLGIGPATLDPHLFINVYTAVRTSQVSNVNEEVGMQVQRIREDRILHEATGGDVRRLCDLFGLSIKGAERYTATLGHPDLGRSESPH